MSRAKKILGILADQQARILSEETETAPLVKDPPQDSQQTFEQVLAEVLVEWDGLFRSLADK